MAGKKAGRPRDEDYRESVLSFQITLTIFYFQKCKKILFWQPTYDLHSAALGDRVEEWGLRTHLTPAH